MVSVETVRSSKMTPQHDLVIPGQNICTGSS